MNRLFARISDLADKTSKAFAKGRFIYLLSTNHIRILRRAFDAYERFMNPLPQSYKRNNSSKRDDGWSFVIVTDGVSNDNLTKSLKSILEEFGKTYNFEIIVVGQNSNYPIINEKIKYISYNGLSFMPGYITYKKNLGAKTASYDKLVIMHDYIALCKNWKSGYEKFDSSFDVCTNILLDKQGRRSVDWTVKNYPGIGNKGLALLPYKEYSDYIYLSGAYFVVKASFFLENLLDESRRWNEKEDFEWSDRIVGKTHVRLNFESSSCFVKEKPVDFPPYSAEWINATIKLYTQYDIEISEKSFVEVVRLN